ncbi:MAG: PilC/PilY family type IV pilus protein [Thermodesulfobacteriota bacterium]
MLRKMHLKTTMVPGLAALVVVALLFVQAFAAEPEMASYTSYPIFLSQSVVPNIMIILDNSGSMNEPAYPVGEPYLVCGQVTVNATANRDDAEEKYGWAVDGSSYSHSTDLDLGALDAGATQDILVGIRFPNAGLPQGATITKAEIRFKACANTAGAAHIKIYGIKETDTAQFLDQGYEPSDGSFNVKNRPQTTNFENWIPGDWTSGTVYTSPDLKTIVQELVNQDGWTTSSPVGFKIYPVNGKRDAYAADNATANEPVLYVEYTSEDCYKYYGYFDPDSRYSYSSNKFQRDPNGPWSGDWLNWLTMRKVDVTRKVMMGGLATARTGGGNQTNYGEAPGAGNRTYYKSYNNPSATTGVSPYAGNQTYKIDNGYIYVTTSGNAKFTIAVQKDATAEPQDFVDGNLAGVLQKVGDKARWGNMWFYYGTGTNSEGGFVSNPIGTNLTTLVTDLQNTAANTWTPLAETYYVCARYFMQVKPQSGLGYHNNAIGAINNTMDPYYDTDFLECAKSFVILLTDGMSTKDSKIPADLKDYDGDGDRLDCTESSCEFPSGGSDHLDDVALWARTTDLRPDGGTKALEGDQNLILYTVYAFGGDEDAKTLLKDAAKNGGFDDKNGSDTPDLNEEWDKDGDGVPDTYYEASNGYLMEKQLMKAITDILKRASAGTAVSVLATSSEGEGTLVQAYFKPSITEGLNEITWVGYMHALWVDSMGRAREDTAPQGTEPGLDIKHDQIVEFFYDDRSGEAKFKRFELDANGDKSMGYTDQNGNGQFDPDEPYIDVNLNGTWDPGEPFDDANANGVLDSGEPFNDINGDGLWTEGDTFTDVNGNGQWDDDEPFIDINGDHLCCAPAEPYIEGAAPFNNGEYDPPENFVDANGNGVWDSAEPWQEVGGDPAAYDDGTDIFIPCGGGLTYTAETCHDRNGDGFWNPAEDYSDTPVPGLYTDGQYDPGDYCMVHDLNGNTVWDEGEPFIDMNGDGYYDAGVDVFNADTSCDTNLNGQRDPAETYTDLNLDGQWNQAEPFTDTNGNGVYDEPEPYVDQNSDGHWTAGESFTDTNGNGYYDPAEPYSDVNANGQWDAGEPWWYIYTEHLMDELEPLWEAGEKLADRDPATRRIKTFVDLDFDGVVDTGESIDFSTDPSASPDSATDNAYTLKPYLGVKDDTAYAHLGSTENERAKNLVMFILGYGSGFYGSTDLRDRTLGGKIWKLGDIVYSTPVTLGRPMDNYGLIYGDLSYQTYYNQYKNREQLVYVGANDGLLHAFLMGQYTVGDNPATAGTTEQIYFTRSSDSQSANLAYGDEVWAYAPQALLPHLKWLADPDYTHVYYVDLKPRLVDAKLWDAADSDHPGGWGTILLGGLNMGGKSIWSTSTFGDGSTDRTFTSSYFALDVTNPHNPVLLWEKTYSTVGLTTSQPTVAKVGDKWFAIFGSGPTDYTGTSTQQPHVYILNLLTGETKRDYQIAVNDSFMGAGPVTVDIGLNYNVDTGYIGLTYQSGANWKGKMYRIRVPKTSGDWRIPSLSDVYDDDPANWNFSLMLDVDGPVTASPSASVDNYDNLWIYFGTGRFFSDDDKTDMSAQYFHGVKDPYYNQAMYTTEAAASSQSPTGFDLLDSTDIGVYTDQTVTGHPDTGVDTWIELLSDMRTRDGWRVTLGTTAETDGERVLNKPTVLGGIVFDTTYIPSSDPCGFGGSSSLLGLYYETGTAYIEEVFIGGTTEVTVGGETKNLVGTRTNLGVGRGSSVAIHVGRQEGATGYVQQSTGIVQSIELNPAFKVKSGFIYWRER